MFGATDAAAKLIEVGENESVGPGDDNGVLVRDSEPTLNNRRAHEDVDFSRDKTRHDFLEFVRVHLAMCNLHSRVRDKIDNLFANAFNRLDAIVQKINLTMTFEFAVDCVPNDSLVIAADDRFNGQTVD